jgi:hypothetical protein
MIIHHFLLILWLVNDLFIIATSILLPLDQCFLPQLIEVHHFKVA